MHKPFFITNKANETTAEIFLYGYIDSYDVSAGDFVKELRSLEKEYANIHVRINSGGGNVFEGLAMYNAMVQSKANIETYIDGIAASMASIVALAGKKCHMSKSARLMTHQPSTGSYGTTEEHEKNVQLLKGIEKTMLAVYMGKTGKTEEDCRAAFMNGKDNWFTAEEAKENGLVDNIYDAEPVELPKTNATDKTVWDVYNQKFAAVFTQKTQTENMELNISAASKAALNITGVADASAIDAAIAVLKEKADKVDTLTAEKDQAETALANLKKANATAEVDTLLAQAKTNKKIMEATATQLKADYAENPAGLKAILDSMVPMKTVTGALKPEAEDTDETMKAEYDKLDKNGGLPALKEKNADRFNALYKAKFGKEYSGK